MNSSVLDDVCRAIGYTPTRYLVAWFPGRSLYVPVSADEAHPLRWLLGRAAFLRLVREFAGRHLAIPVDAHDAQYRIERGIAEALAGGAPLPDVAASVGLSLRRLQQIRAELVERGWLDYAGRKPGRAAGLPPPRLVDFLGTGDGSGEPPAPAA